MGFFSPYVKVKCPDGPRFILKKPEKAFSIVAPDWNVRIGAITKALELVGVKFEVEVKKRIKALVENLDKHYAGLLAHYQAAYLYFCTNPCDKKSNAALAKANEEIRNKEFKLREIEIQMEKSLESLVSKPPSKPKRGEEFKVSKIMFKRAWIPTPIEDIEKLEKLVSDYAPDYSGFAPKV